MKNHRPATSPLHSRHQQLWTRRQLLLAAAGGSLALLFGLPAGAAVPPAEQAWPVLDAVQQQLFPDEAEAPGARAIHALDYLRGVLEDPRVDQADKDFILQGVQWLEQLSQDRHGAGFLQLEQPLQAQLLQQIARSQAGENWLSTLLTYIFEALLTAPAYGGNPEGIGWKWLRYTPGFPLPDQHTVHWKLPR